MEVLVVISGLISFYIIGLTVCSVLGIKILNLEKIGLSFGIGAGLVSLEVIAFSFLGIPLNFIFVLLPWYIAFMYLLIKRRVFTPENKNEDRFTLFDYTFMLLIIVMVITAGVHAVISPVSAWDSTASWSLLAKGFYYDGFLSLNFYEFVNFDNPPLIPVQQAFLSHLIGAYNDTEAMLLFTGYFVSLLILFYALLKKISTPTNALIFTFLLSSTPLLLSQAGRLNVGYVDLPLAYFVLSVVAVLGLPFKHPEKGKVFLLGLLLSFCILTKNEGMGIAISSFFILTVILIKRGKVSYLLYFAMGTLPFFIWKVYTLIEGFPVHYLYFGKPVFGRIPAILMAFFSEFLMLNKWNLLWVSFLFSLFILVKNRFIKIVLFILLLQLLVYFLIYVFTPLDLIGHMNASLDRFLLQMAPLAMLVVGYVFANPSIYHEKK